MPRAESTESSSWNPSPEAVAYGLRLAGVDRRQGLLAAGDEHWPLIDVRQEPARAVDPQRLDAHHARLDLDPHGRRLALDRARRRATFSGPRLDPDELAHPYLGPIATVFGRWLGRETFHAGAFVADGHAWGLVGPREAGKSSLLAALTAAGWSVLADDLLIVDGGRALAGPRLIDLRSPPFPGLEHELAVTPARAATRWRIRIPGVDRAFPLAGWVFLDWGGQVELASVPAADCLARLARWRGWPQLATDPADLLALGALPAFDLRRPRRWDALAETIAALDERTRRHTRAPA